MYFFAMKLFFMIYLFWIITSVKGLPNDYEQRLQPRSLSDWFYGDSRDSDQLNSKSFKDISNDGDPTNVIPVDEPGPNDKPEPIENLLKELKEKAQADKDSTNSKSIYKEDKNITSLLKDLKKTVTDTPAKLAKVFVNKTWRIFDIGALGSSRRTRNVDDTTYLISIFNLFNWFTQLLSPVYPQEKISQGNALHQSLNPITSLAKQYSSKIPNVQPVRSEKQNSSENPEFEIIVNKKNRDTAVDTYKADTTEEIISKVEKSLGRGDLDIEKQFYIVLVLDQLYDRLFKIQNNETKLDLIYLIIKVGGDRRFKNLFEILGQSENRDDKVLEKFFRKDGGKYDRIRSIERDIREKKVTEQPLPENCLITGPPKEVSEQGEGDNKRTITTYHTWNVESDDDNYKLCIDDNSETEANKLLKTDNDKPVDVVLKRIKWRLNNLEYSFPISNPTEIKWFIILKLYKMFDNIGSDQEEDREKIKRLMTSII